MTAETLRAAATRLRELAEAATPGPWQTFEQHGRDYTDEGWSQIGGVKNPRGHDVALTYDIGFDNDYHEADAAYIAAMSPTVALALADWLDETAVIAGENGGWTPGEALAVANAILTDPSP